MTQGPQATPDDPKSDLAGDMPGDASADAHAPDAVRSLRVAMRRARADDAERSGAIADLRAARLTRLEVLREALRPLVAQIPRDADIFDIGLMPGANPRLFIDMIGFVEMGRDGRLYRLVQDSRHGRATLAETVEVDTMVDAVTDYVARRLLERDKALASDTRPSAGAGSTTDRVDPRPAGAPVADAAPRERRGALRILGIAFAFVIDLLGSIAFFTILVGIGWLFWTHGRGQGG